jgi:1,5-anhydro-D-fructose reductase (1,5-anhydro-D-mannitol-forming)
MIESMNRRRFLGLTGASLALAGVVGAKEGGDLSMLRVAMLSQWHAHAKGYADRLRSLPEVKITAVWDEQPERGAAWAQELKADFEADLAALLRRDDVDAVACNAPTSMHAELMTASANAGKHVFTEKVMALTVDECNRIGDAVKKNNVKFCISFPFRTRSEVLYAKHAVEEGLLGQLTFIRVRVAHNGGSGGWLPPHFWDPLTTGGAR